MIDATSYIELEQVRETATHAATWQMHHFDKQSLSDCSAHNLSDIFSALKAIDTSNKVFLNLMRWQVACVLQPMWLAVAQ